MHFQPGEGPCRVLLRDCEMRVEGILGVGDGSSPRHIVSPSTAADQRRIPDAAADTRSLSPDSWIPAAGRWCGAIPTRNQAPAGKDITRFREIQPCFKL